MTADYQSDGSIYSENCKYVIRKTADDGTTSDEVKYDDGSSRLVYDNVSGILSWIDYSGDERVTTEFKK